MKSNIPTLVPGYRSGRLTVLSEAESHWQGRLRRRRVLCRCDCGRETILRADSLRPGGTLSCGCLLREASVENAGNLNHTHGKTQTPEYRAWKAMRRRCSKPHDAAYRYYGGRGIAVCERWGSFEAFLEDMGPRPTPQHSLNRLDNDGNYEPGNVEWATAKAQTRNQRRNRMLTFEGETLCLTDWAERLGIPAQTLSQRLLVAGWSVERALTEPLNR